jgi:hypothetical protein
MRRTEEMHNTREQVSEYIATALEIVAELEIADDLRVPAFEKAVDMVAGKKIIFEQVMPGGVDLTGVRMQG